MINIRSVKVRDLNSHRHIQGAAVVCNVVFVLCFLPLLSKVLSGGAGSISVRKASFLPCIDFLTAALPASEAPLTNTSTEAIGPPVFAFLVLNEKSTRGYADIFGRRASVTQ